MLYLLVEWTLAHLGSIFIPHLNVGGQYTGKVVKTGQRNRNIPKPFRCKLSRVAGGKLNRVKPHFINQIKNRKK